MLALNLWIRIKIVNEMRLHGTRFNWMGTGLGGRLACKLNLGANQICLIGSLVVIGTLSKSK